MSRFLSIHPYSILAALTCCVSLAHAQTLACQPGDNVCVTQQSHAQVIADNRLAATRVLTAAPASEFAAAGALPNPIDGQRPGMPENRPIDSPVQLMPGFHIASGSPVISHPAQLNLHPHPAPLTGEQINTAIAKYGIHPVGLHLPVPPDITYQLELFDSSSGSEVNTNFVQSTVFYSSGNQSMGYIQIDFNVNPGIQNLLDCSLGADGTFKVATSMTGVPNAEGNLSSFNRHLMIPFSTTPANAKTAQSVIYFNNIEFDGCALQTVSH